MAYYDDPDVQIADAEMKRNNRSAKKLAKMRSEDFTLYTSTAEDFDMSEITGTFDTGIGFSDDY
jgi:hypothetical protein